jgi:hypothetical protein
MRRFIDILVVVVLLFACGCTDTTTPEQEAQVVLKSLSITPRSITFVVGGSKALKVTSNPVVEGLTFTWSSTNSSVATVNELGVVKAHAEGTAEIICSYNDQISARCSVTVIPRTEPEPEPEPEPKPEPEPQPEPKTLASLLSESLIFSSRQLRYPGTVMQCFDFYDPSENGYIYFSQCAGDTTTGSKWLVVVSRVKRGAYGDSTRSGEEMLLRWFGHGTNLCVEQATDGGEDFIWVGSNGTVSGTDYTNNKTFSRIRFQPKATFEHYSGENFYLSSYTDTSGTKWSVHNLQVTPDFDNRRLLITASSSGRRHILVYNLDDVLALKEQSITLTLTWGGEANTNTERKEGKVTLNARVLNSLTPISSFRISSALNSGDYTKTWSCSFQGQGIYGDKIFWYEGQPLESKSGSGVYDNARAYLEVFDYNGNRIKPRTRVAAISDFENMKRLLNLNENLFSEAEGMQIKNGGKTLYLGVTTHLAGATSKNRLSTILQYDF